MTEQDTSEEMGTDEVEVSETFWSAVPTVFADGLLAHAQAGGIYRLMLGEMIYNPKEGATRPAMRSVLNLAMSRDALKSLVKALAELDGITEDV